MSQRALVDYFIPLCYYEFVNASKFHNRMSPKELVDNILGFTAKTSYTLSRTCIKIFNNITHNSHGFVDAIYFSIIILKGQ